MQRVVVVETATAEALGHRKDLVEVGQAIRRQVAPEIVLALERDMLVETGPMSPALTVAGVEEVARGALEETTAVRLAETGELA